MTDLPAPTLPTPPLLTHWLWWADSELAHITPRPGAGGWLLRLSAASVGRSPVPVAAPPTGVQAKSVAVGTVTGVVLWADAVPGAAPANTPALNGCLGRIAHGRWVATSGLAQTWWPLLPGEAGGGEGVARPPSGAGVLELAFSNGSALRLPLAGLRAEWPAGAVFHESMAC
jgi:hypothetical protein